MKPTVLAIDDDLAFLDAMELVLGNTYEVRKATSGSAGVSKLAESSFSAVLLDINLPDLDGLEVLGKILERSPLLPVIMLTGVDKTEKVVEAVKKGAFDYFTKPIDRDKLLMAVRNAVQKHASDRARANLIEDAVDQYKLIGSSEVMIKAKDKLARAALAEVAILITGETGTGKDLAARLAHYWSPRAGGKFVSVNMASIPSELMESELFGHEKGAFTGAIQSKRGLFEIANGGTIFLDEIGLATKAVQGKILRAVESREFRRVGGTSDIRVDVRIIAATNKNLENEIAQSSFLPDLYYRLNTINVHIPPLRERKQDIDKLFQHFMRLRATEMGKQPKLLDDGARRFLLSYAWPGNVRELKSLVDRILVLSDSSSIDGSEISLYFENVPETSLPLANLDLQTSLQQREKELISMALIAHEYNISRTAETLGMHRVTLHKKIKALGLDPGNV